MRMPVRLVVLGSNLVNFNRFKFAFCKCSAGSHFILCSEAREDNLDLCTSEESLNSKEKNVCYINCYNSNSLKCEFTATTIDR